MANNTLELEQQEATNDTNQIHDDTDDTQIRQNTTTEQHQSQQEYNDAPPSPHIPQTNNDAKNMNFPIPFNPPPNQDIENYTLSPPPPPPNNTFTSTTTITPKESNYDNVPTSDTSALSTQMTKSPPSVPGVPKENLKLWLQAESSNPTPPNNKSKKNHTSLTIPQLEDTRNNDDVSFDIENDSTPRASSHAAKRKYNDNNNDHEEEDHDNDPYRRLQLVDSNQSNSTPQLSSSLFELTSPLYHNNMDFNVVSGGPLDSNTSATTIPTANLDSLDELNQDFLSHLHDEQTPFKATITTTPTTPAGVSRHSSSPSLILHANKSDSTQTASVEEHVPHGILRTRLNSTATHHSSSSSQVFNQTMDGSTRTATSAGGGGEDYIPHGILRTRLNSEQISLASQNDVRFHHDDAHPSLPHTTNSEDSNRRLNTHHHNNNNSNNNNNNNNRNYKSQNMFMRLWYKCPQMNRPSWSRVSSAVVRNAPCFWCCGRRLGINSTDRMILTRLNILCAFFALCQVAVGIFLLIVLLSPTVVDRQYIDDDVDGKFGYYVEALSINLWTPSGSCLALSLVGALVFVSMLASIPVIRQVNLQGAIRYMWLLYWIIPLQILFVIALFDYHGVIDVWLKYYWSGPSMAWFRKLFCEKSSIGECAVPINGGRYFPTEDDWCYEQFNNTICSGIRENAVQTMSTVSYSFFFANSIGGLVLVVLLLLSLSMLENIISAPIVTSSQEANIPLWLTIPVCFSILGGYGLLFSSQSVFKESSSTVSIHWIAIFYLVSAAFFAVSALLGWYISSKTVLNTRDKAQKQIAVYAFIGMVIFTIIAVGAIFIASLMYSVNLVDIGFTDNQRGSVACYVDAIDSCSNCNETTASLIEKPGCNETDIGILNDDEVPPDDCRICPEWVKGDVVTIMQTQMKQSVTLSSIFLMFALRSLRFGFVLRSAMSRYEIDYV